MKVKVVRLEAYPQDVPTGKAVGFQLTFQNGRMSYLDTVVDLTLSDEDAVEQAFEDLQDQIQNQLELYGSLSPVLGTEWEVEEPEIEEDSDETV